MKSLEARAKEAPSITDEILDAIRGLKIENPKSKPEKFVNVGIEAVIRLFADNRAITDSRVESRYTNGALDERKRIVELIEAQIQRLNTIHDTSILEACKCEYSYAIRRLNDLLTKINEDE